MTSIEKNIKVKTISQTVSDAAEKAAEQLKQKTPLPSILVVENELNCTLIVASYQNQLGVYRIGENDSQILHLVPGDKYRALLFDECQNVQVVILSKLLKCSFVRASGCSVLFRIPLIGALEFFKCKQSDITLQKPLNLVPYWGRKSAVPIPKITFFKKIQTNRKIYILRFLLQKQKTRSDQYCDN